MAILSTGRIELRDTIGQIVRLGQGGEFKLVDTPLGIRPEYYGEVGILRKNRQCGKYRTSCYKVPFPANEPADILVRPGSMPNTDVYHVFTGAIAITEYDSTGRPYGICYVEEGKELVLGYDPAKTGPDRYNVVSQRALADADYDYWVTQYLDPRKWRP